MVTLVPMIGMVPIPRRQEHEPRRHQDRPRPSRPDRYARDRRSGWPYEGPKYDEHASLAGDKKVIDYGHVCSLLQEKYGKIRGEKSYEGLVDMGNRMWTVAQKIQREKLGMMAALRKTGDVNSHHYQGLYKLYMEKAK